MDPADVPPAPVWRHRGCGGLVRFSPGYLGTCGHCNGRFVDTVDCYPAAGDFPFRGPAPQDLAEMRSQLLGNISFTPTDGQLRATWYAHPDLVGLALTWSWSDTEVRDQLCAVLEAEGPHGVS